MLAREGITMNHKKLLRLYREEGLAVRRRRGRKRATGTRALLALPQGPNQRWSLAFVADAESQVQALLKARLPKTAVSAIACGKIAGLFEITAGENLFYAIG